MSRKHFDKEIKIKYAKLNIEVGLLDAAIHFLYEFEERYLDAGLGAPKGNAKSYNPASHAKRLIIKGTNKYNLLGEVGLENMTGKKTSGRPKKRSINELNEQDRELYQEIMEEILKERGISPSVIHDKIKEKKEKKGKTFSNFKAASEILNINRTSHYSNYHKKVKDNSTSLEKNYVPGLKEGMTEMILKSDYTVGRDKLHKTYNNLAKTKVSSYVGRLHGETLDYVSKAYVRKNTNNPPKENKFAGVYCEDKVAFNHKSEFPNQKGYADISYIFIKNSGGYLHVITESYSNSIIAGTISKERTSKSTIELLKLAHINAKGGPNIFHTDHGVEYANQYVTIFLNENNITQSMSPKGNSLANRPSEYLFSLIKREKLYLYNLEELSLEQVKILLTEYFSGYHTGRIQRSLQNKTPHDFLNHVEHNKMCLNFAS